jgi:hypothetical protein
VYLVNNAIPCNLVKNIIKQYETFASYDGVKFNAELTVGEDMADISGMAICQEYLLDYFEVGEVKVLDFDGIERTATGTSVSVQVAAAKWMKLREYFPYLTTFELFQKLDMSTTLVRNSKIQAGKAFPAIIENPDREIRIQSESDELNQLRIELAKLYSIIRELLLMLRR